MAGDPGTIGAPDSVVEAESALLKTGGVSEGVASVPWSASCMSAEAALVPWSPSGVPLRLSLSADRPPMCAVPSVPLSAG